MHARRRAVHGLFSPVRGSGRKPRKTTESPKKTMKAERRSIKERPAGKAHGISKRELGAMRHSLLSSFLPLLFLSGSERGWGLRQTQNGMRCNEEIDREGEGGRGGPGCVENRDGGPKNGVAVASGTDSA